MWRRAMLAFLPLAVLIAIPILLRPAGERRSAGELSLVIITPHNEAIRYEFERAFPKWYAQHHPGQTVRLDWRAPGGTSDATRYIDDQFRTAFRQWWTANRGPWTREVAEAFNNKNVDPADPKQSEVARQARQAFLDSNVGIGIDLFFGGGQFDHHNQGRMGHAVDAGLAARHPEWFRPEIIPGEYSGEIFYDSKGRYYGACLSAFGICYSPDRLRLLADPSPPTHWEDLGDPRFYGQTAVADPTKSGSINKCFEMLLQEQMAQHPQDLDAGWAQGLNLIKRIGGNARYLSDSASKVPLDVARGDTVAGMCIDFYGRSQGDFTAFQGGSERIVYRTPAGGSSISVDPIQLLRGAPQRELAIEFMEFVLSDDGQKLWNYRVGEPGGPLRYALRRLPVRRDLYTPAHRVHMSDPTADPYLDSAKFKYQAAWTGPYFGLIRTLIRTMVLDPAPELQAAWGAIVAAGGPAKVPQAMAEFERLPFPYAEAKAARDRLNGDPLPVLQVQREWCEFFRARYQRAAELARAGK